MRKGQQAFCPACVNRMEMLLHLFLVQFHLPRTWLKISFNFLRKVLCLTLRLKWTSHISVSLWQCSPVHILLLIWWNTLPHFIRFRENCRKMFLSPSRRATGVLFFIQKEIHSAHNDVRTEPVQVWKYYACQLYTQNDCEIDKTRNFIICCFHWIQPYYFLSDINVYCYCLSTLFESFHCYTTNMEISNGEKPFLVSGL